MALFRWYTTVTDSHRQPRAPLGVESWIFKGATCKSVPSLFVKFGVRIRVELHLTLPLLIRVIPICAGLALPSISNVALTCSSYVPST